MLGIKNYVKPWIEHRPFLFLFDHHHYHLDNQEQIFSIIFYEKNHIQSKLAFTNLSGRFRMKNFNKQFM